MNKDTMLRLIQVTAFIAIALLSRSNCLAEADKKGESGPQSFFRINYTPLRSGSNVLGQPLVQVVLNGRENTTFLVDTGSSASFISTDLAKRLGLHSEPAIAKDGKSIYWNNKQAKEVTIDRLTTGTAAFDNVKLVVADTRTFTATAIKSSAGSYDGIIGIDMLDHFAVLLNFKQHEIRLYPPSHILQAQLVQMGLPEAYTLPMSKHELRWFVSAEFINDGRSFNTDILLDIGSDSTYISEQLGQKLHLRASHPLISSNVYGSQSDTESIVDEIHFGPLTLTHFSIVVHPPSQAGDDILGLDILSQYLVLLNFPERQMRLQSAAAYYESEAKFSVPRTSYTP